MSFAKIDKIQRPYTRFSAFSVRIEYRRNKSISASSVALQNVACPVPSFEFSTRSGLPSASAYCLTSYRKAEILNATRTQQFSAMTKSRQESLRCNHHTRLNCPREVPKRVSIQSYLFSTYWSDKQYLWIRRKASTLGIQLTGTNSHQFTLHLLLWISLPEFNLNQLWTRQIFFALLFPVFDWQSVDEKVYSVLRLRGCYQSILLGGLRLVTRTNPCMDAN